MSKEQSTSCTTTNGRSAAVASHQTYLNEHNVPALLNQCLCAVLQERPADPSMFIAQFLSKGKLHVVDDGPGRAPTLPDPVVPTMQRVDVAEPTVAQPEAPLLSLELRSRYEDGIVSAMLGYCPPLRVREALVAGQKKLDWDLTVPTHSSVLDGSLSEPVRELLATVASLWLRRSSLSSAELRQKGLGWICKTLSEWLVGKDPRRWLNAMEQRVLAACFLFTMDYEGPTHMEHLTQAKQTAETFTVLAPTAFDPSMFFRDLTHNYAGGSAVVPSPSVVWFAPYRDRRLLRSDVSAALERHFRSHADNVQLLSKQVSISARQQVVALLHTLATASPNNPNAFDQGGEPSSRDSLEETLQGSEDLVAELWRSVVSEYRKVTLAHCGCEKDLRLEAFLGSPMWAKVASVKEAHPQARPDNAFPFKHDDAWSQMKPGRPIDHGADPLPTRTASQEEKDISMFISYLRLKCHTEKARDVLSLFIERLLVVERLTLSSSGKRNTPMQPLYFNEFLVCFEQHAVTALSLHEELGFFDVRRAARSAYRCTTNNQKQAVNARPQRRAPPGGSAQNDACDNVRSLIQATPADASEAEAHHLAHLVESLLRQRPAVNDESFRNDAAASPAPHAPSFANSPMLGPISGSFPSEQEQHSQSIPCVYKLLTDKSRLKTGAFSTVGRVVRFPVPCLVSQYFPLVLWSLLEDSEVSGERSNPLLLEIFASTCCAIGGDGFYPRAKEGVLSSNSYFVIESIRVGPPPTASLSDEATREMYTGCPVTPPWATIVTLREVDEHAALQQALRHMLRRSPSEVSSSMAWCMIRGKRVLHYSAPTPLTQLEVRIRFAASSSDRPLSELCEEHQLGVPDAAMAAIRDACVTALHLHGAPSEDHELREASSEDVTLVSDQFSLASSSLPHKGAGRMRDGARLTISLKTLKGVLETFNSQHLEERQCTVRVAEVYRSGVANNRDIRFLCALLRLQPPVTTVCLAGQPDVSDESIGEVLSLLGQNNLLTLFDLTGTSVSQRYLNAVAALSKAHRGISESVHVRKSNTWASEVGERLLVSLQRPANDDASKFSQSGATGVRVSHFGSPPMDAAEDHTSHRIALVAAVPEFRAFGALSLALTKTGKSVKLLSIEEGDLSCTGVFFEASRWTDIEELHLRSISAQECPLSVAHRKDSSVLEQMPTGAFDESDDADAPDIGSLLTAPSTITSLWHSVRLCKSLKRVRLEGIDPLPSGLFSGLIQLLPLPTYGSTPGPISSSYRRLNTIDRASSGTLGSVHFDDCSVDAADAVGFLLEVLCSPHPFERCTFTNCDFDGNVAIYPDDVVGCSMTVAGNDSCDEAPLPSHRDDGGIGDRSTSRGTSQSMSWLNHAEGDVTSFEEALSTILEESGEHAHKVLFGRCGGVPERWQQK